MKRFAVVASLAGVVSLSLMQSMADETPERAKPAAGEATLPQLGAPPSTVVEDEVDPAVAETGSNQQPAGEQPAGEQPAGEQPPAGEGNSPPEAPSSETTRSGVTSASPADLQKELDVLRADLAASRKEIEILKKQVDDLTRLQSSQNADLLAVLRQVAEEDANGGWRLKLNTLSDKDGKPPADVVRATQGRLLIENNGAERLLYVNGTPWKAIPGKSYIWVPTGKCTISTEGGVEPTVYQDWQRNPTTGEFELKFRF